MKTRIPPGFEPPPIEMTIDGQFREPPSAPIAAKVGGVALIVAVMATAGAMALLALWFALAMIPLALGAGLIAYAAMRFQRWRGQGPFGR
jgi:hypothetical protein